MNIQTTSLNSSNQYFGRLSLYIGAATLLVLASIFVYFNPFSSSPVRKITTTAIQTPPFFAQFSEATSEIDQGNFSKALDISRALQETLSQIQEKSLSLKQLYVWNLYRIATLEERLEMPSFKESYQKLLASSEDSTLNQAFQMMEKSLNQKDDHFKRYLTMKSA